MSKIAGIKNKSPETYPGPKAKPTVVETLSTTNVSTAAIGTGFATLLVAPLSFTPEVPGVKATILVSGVLQTPSPNGQTTVAIVLDNETAPPAYELAFEVNASDSPIPFSLVFETTVLTPSAPLTIDVQAKTASGSAVATDVSLVVMASTA